MSLADEIRTSTEWAPYREGLEEPTQPLGLADLLEQIETTLKRFVVFQNDAQPVAVALWVAFTYGWQECATTVYLNIYSAEKRSGKTRLLDVLEVLVNGPWRTVQPSEAVLFRKLEKDKPTLMLDETDAIFKGRSEDTQGLRAVLNAGHRRGAKVPRCSDRGKGIEEFDVWGPKALAGIGRLPETITDRAIPIHLKRRAPFEAVDGFRFRDVREQQEDLRLYLAEWGEDVVAKIGEARPEIPRTLNDRAADGWEPLLAIADLAGEDWPTRARQAATALHGYEEDDDSLGIQLLADISKVFGEDEKLRSTVLVERLIELEESPWGDLWGKELDPRGLARRLKPFEVKPQTQRLGEVVFKGYAVADFEDAFARYLSPPDVTVTTVTQAGEEGFVTEEEGFVTEESEDV